jgi:hypothetical protein
MVVALSFPDHTGFFIEAVRTVFTAAFAAITSFFVVRLRENDVSVFIVIKIFWFKRSGASETTHVIRHCAFARCKNRQKTHAFWNENMKNKSKSPFWVRSNYL